MGREKLFCAADYGTQVMDDEETLAIAAAFAARMDIK